MAGRLLAEEKELGIYEDDASGSSDDDDPLSEHEDGAVADRGKGKATKDRGAPAAAAGTADDNGGGRRAAASVAVTANEIVEPARGTLEGGDDRAHNAQESAEAEATGARLSSRTTTADRGSPGERGGDSNSSSSRAANVLVTAALELLHQRCVSVVKQKAPFYETARSPLANQRCVKYISVSQSLPLPMEPLKAWKGYNGNLYFEPISIKPARLGSVTLGARDGGSDVSLTAASSASPRLGKARTAPASRGERGGRRDGPETAVSTERAAVDAQPDILFRQMSLLDKRAVMSRLNRNLHEDLAWIRGQEAVGSLIEAAAPGDKARERDKYRPERIRKGSVVATRSAAAAAGDERAASRASAASAGGGRGGRAATVAVSGAKFHAPLYMSPLLRTTTQYSQSAQRVATSSPELYNSAGSYERLPPLEQLRASLRHIDNNTDRSRLLLLDGGGVGRGRRVGVVEKPLAYVKYSRDVKTLY